MEGQNNYYIPDFLAGFGENYKETAERINGIVGPRGEIDVPFLEEITGRIAAHEKNLPVYGTIKEGAYREGQSGGLEKAGRNLGQAKRLLEEVIEEKVSPALGKDFEYFKKEREKAEEKEDARALEEDCDKLMETYRQVQEAGKKIGKTVSLTALEKYLGFRERIDKANGELEEVIDEYRGKEFRTAAELRYYASKTREFLEGRFTMEKGRLFEDNSRLGKYKKFKWELTQFEKRFKDVRGYRSNLTEALRQIEKESKRLKKESGGEPSQMRGICLEGFGRWIYMEGRVEEYKRKEAEFRELGERKEEERRKKEEERRRKEEERIRKKEKLINSKKEAQPILFAEEVFEEVHAVPSSPKVLPKVPDVPKLPGAVKRKTLYDCFLED